METLVKYAVLFLFGLFQFVEAIAASSPQKQNESFMSARDLSSETVSSNLNIKNNGSRYLNLYGLYIRQLSQVSVGQPCSSGSVIFPNSGVGALANTSAGSIVMRVFVGPRKEATIGANFLYNMIYGSSLYVQTTYPSSPPGCFLPGCTWGSDTLKYNWCVQLGVMAPVYIKPGYTTSNVPPSMKIVSTSDYNYNIVNSGQDLGPISCDDQNLTCSANTSQTQSF